MKIADFNQKDLDEYKSLTTMFEKKGWKNCLESAGYDDDLEIEVIYALAIDDTRIEVSCCFEDRQWSIVVGSQQEEASEIYYKNVEDFTELTRWVIDHADTFKDGSGMKGLIHNYPNAFGFDYERGEEFKVLP